jgi:hypothetical protein
MPGAHLDTGPGGDGRHVHPAPGSARILGTLFDHSEPHAVTFDPVNSPSWGGYDGVAA